MVRRRDCRAQPPAKEGLPAVAAAAVGRQCVAIGVQEQTRRDRSPSQERRTGMPSSAGYRSCVHARQRGLPSIADSEPPCRSAPASAFSPRARVTERPSLGDAHPRCRRTLKRTCRRPRADSRRRRQQPRGYGLPDPRVGMGTSRSCADRAGPPPRNFCREIVFAADKGRQCHRPRRTCLLSEALKVGAAPLAAVTGIRILYGTPSNFNL
jgi:hypothetical protein